MVHESGVCEDKKRQRQHVPSPQVNISLSLCPSHYPPGDYWRVARSSAPPFIQSVMLQKSCSSHLLALADF